MPYWDERQDQDESLAQRSAGTVESFGLYMQVWLADEVRRLIPLAQTLQSTYSGPHASSVKRAVRALEEMENYEIHETFGRLKERAKEIAGGVSSTPLDAHLDMIDALSGFERLMRRILVIRGVIEEHWFQGQGASQSDP